MKIQALPTPLYDSVTRVERPLYGTVRGLFSGPAGPTAGRSYDGAALASRAIDAALRELHRGDPTFVEACDASAAAALQGTVREALRALRAEGAAATQRP